MALPADLPLVAADPSLLRQALAHLLDNAREAVPDGGRVAVTARVDELTAQDCQELLGSAPPGDRVVLLKVHKESLAQRFEPVIEAISEAGGDLVHVLEEKKN